MSYEKQTWVTGETITAEKLNHMEDGIEANQPGYECTESRTVLTDESVTTIDQQSGYASGALSYPLVLTQDELTITFDGVEYVCHKSSLGIGTAYGAAGSDGPDFTDYPFAIFSYENSGTVYNQISTENAGTYSLKIEEVTRTVTTTPCFERAVNAVPSSGGSAKLLIFNVSWNEGSPATSEYTLQELREFYDEGYYIVAKVAEKRSGAPYAQTFYLPMHLCGEYDPFIAESNVVHQSSSYLYIENRNLLIMSDEITYTRVAYKVELVVE